ncbi:hypothetical protein AAZV13_10G089450 [Glycine max]
MVNVGSIADRSKAKKATALDRANAEEALLPIPKVFDSHEKEKAFQNSLDKDVIDDFHRSSKDDSVEIEGLTFAIRHMMMMTMKEVFVTTLCWRTLQMNQI